MSEFSLRCGVTTPLRARHGGKEKRKEKKEADRIGVTNIRPETNCGGGRARGKYEAAVTVSKQQVRKRAQIIEVQKGEKEEGERKGGTVINLQLSPKGKREEGRGGEGGGGRSASMRRKKIQPSC